MTLGIVAAFLLVAANAFFVAVEFSVTRTRPTQVDDWERRGAAGAKSVRHAVDHIDAYLSACQLGITLASLGLGIVGERAFHDLFEPLFGEGATVAGIAVAGGIAFLLVTMLHVVVGELSPKSLAIARTGPTVLMLAPPMRLFYYLTKPVVDLFNGMGNLLLKPFGIPPAREAGHAPHTEEELHSIVRHSSAEGEIEKEEGALAERALAFDELRVRAVMRPRHEVALVRCDDSWDAVRERARQTGYTRFPLVEERGGLDAAVGIVNLKDVLLDEDGAKPLREHARPTLRVSDATVLSELLREMRRTAVHMAVAIDEHGTAVGIVTLEDLLEELVGEIEDEFDPDREVALEPDEHGAYVVDGDLSLHALTDQTGLQVSGAHEATIGGHLVEVLGRVPDAGETLEVDGYEAEVLAAGGGRLQRLRITPREAA